VGKQSKLKRNPVIVCDFILFSLSEQC